MSATPTPTKIGDLVPRSGEWLRGSGPMSEVVISTRIRLARNIAGHTFLSKCSRRQRSEIELKAREAILASNIGHRGGGILYRDLEDAPELEQQLLVERHLISKNLANADGARAVAITPGDEAVSIMVNEEDHLRTQVLRSGLQLDEAWEQIDEIDDELDAQLEFSFHPRFGYLTACPTNVGTGIRVSVMLHLPALKLTGEIEKVFRVAKELKLAVRGLYGEGTEATGDLYQVSNQTTLGKDEDDIIADFRDNVIPKIIDYEHQARRTLLGERSLALDDKIHRAFGTLSSARLLGSDEVLYLLSHVRMGVNLGRLERVDVKTLNGLMLMTQPAHLQKILGKKLEGDDRRAARATFIREKLGV